MSIMVKLKKKMNIMVKSKKKNDWCLSFITKDSATNEFIIWDETEANEVGRTKTKKEAIDLCLKYAESL